MPEKLFKLKLAPCIPNDRSLGDHHRQSDIFCRKIRIFHKKHLKIHKIHLNGFLFLLHSVENILYRHLKSTFYVWILHLYVKDTLFSSSRSFKRVVFECIALKLLNTSEEVSHQSFYYGYKRKKRWRKTSSNSKMMS